MPVELLRVERIDSWDSNASSHNVWLVRGWTIEEEPRLLTVRTLNAWNASGDFGHAHHRIPRSRGGQWTLDNMEYLCPECHQLAHLENAL
jgi:hypothetical protein